MMPWQRKIPALPGTTSFNQAWLCKALKNQAPPLRLGCLPTQPTPSLERERPVLVGGTGVI